MAAGSLRSVSQDESFFSAANEVSDPAREASCLFIFSINLTINNLHAIKQLFNQKTKHL